MYILKNKNSITVVYSEQSSKCLTTINPIKSTRKQKQRSAGDLAQTGIESSSSRPHPRLSPPAVRPLYCFCYSQVSHIHVIPCSESPKLSMHQATMPQAGSSYWGKEGGRKGGMMEVTIVGIELGGFVFLCYFSSCPQRLGSF